MVPNLILSMLFLNIMFLLFLFNFYGSSLIHLFIFTEMISALYILFLIYTGTLYNMSIISWLFLILLGIIATKATIVISLIIFNVQSKNNIKKT